MKRRRYNDGCVDGRLAGRIDENDGSFKTMVVVACVKTNGHMSKGATKGFQPSTCGREANKVLGVQLSSPVAYGKFRFWI